MDKFGSNHWIPLFRRVVITLIAINAIIVGLDTYPYIHAAYGQSLWLRGFFNSLLGRSCVLGERQPSEGRRRAHRDPIDTEKWRHVARPDKFPRKSTQIVRFVNRQLNHRF